jgi:WD40 repeat protein
MPRLVIGLSVLVGFAVSVPAQSPKDPLPAGARAQLGEERYPRNAGETRLICYSPDGKTLLACDASGTFRAWDTLTGEDLRWYHGHSGRVHAVAFAPDGTTFFAGSSDGAIYQWETAKEKPLRWLEGHAKGVFALALSPDGKTLVSSGSDSTIRLWDVAGWRELRRIDLPKRTIPSLALSPDGKRLAYPSEEGVITLLDMATGKEMPPIKRPRSSFVNLSFSPDGRVLTGVDGRRTTYLWDAASGRELGLLGKQRGFSKGVVFAPDGRSAATEEGGILRVWEVATRQERFYFRSPVVTPSLFARTLAYAPDGHTLAQGGKDCAVILWDVTGLGEKGRPKPADLSPEALRALWDELAGADAAAAYRAMVRLEAGTRLSVPFLRERLRPIPPVDAGTLARLVHDLDSDRFATRDRATARLEKIGGAAETALRESLNGNTSLERRRRVERLLAKFASEREIPSPDRLRQMRALESLERMDTPASRQALERLAEGAPQADLTVAARGAICRLAKRPTQSP